jgi:hypothetical protein
MPETTKDLHDPVAAEPMTAVNAALVEDAGYVRVRYTGKDGIVFNHLYWNPGDVRTMHPGDLDNLKDKYTGTKDVSFETLPTPATPKVEDKLAEVEKDMGTYHTGHRQAEAQRLGLVAEPTAKERKADNAWAEKADDAQQRQALRDANEARQQRAADVNKTAEVKAVHTKESKG